MCVCGRFSVFYIGSNFTGLNVACIFHTKFSRLVSIIEYSREKCNKNSRYMDENIFKYLITRRPTKLGAALLNT